LAMLCEKVGFCAIASSNPHTIGANLVFSMASL